MFPALIIFGPDAGSQPKTLIIPLPLQMLLDPHTPEIFQSFYVAPLIELLHM